MQPTTETPAPEAAPTPAGVLRPLTNRDLARLAKTGHGQCRSLGYVVLKANTKDEARDTTKRGEPQVLRCSCTSKRVDALLRSGHLVERKGRLFVVAKAA